MRDLYEAQWRNFCGWCAEYGFDPQLGQQIVEYLEHLSEVSLSHNTIMTHVSALSSCTYGIEGVRVGIHPLVSAWVRSHKICHPLVKLRTPPWDLQVSELHALSVQPPFMIETPFHSTCR